MKIELITSTPDGYPLVPSYHIEVSNPPWEGTIKIGESLSKNEAEQQLQEMARQVDHQLKRLQRCEPEHD